MPWQALLMAGWPAFGISWHAGSGSLYGLAGKRVLEVGSGRGYLQDIVAGYTGLDISKAWQAEITNLL
jgi:hypothetical protein